MKFYALALFAAALGFSAQAQQITVTPAVPINCQQAQLDNVSFVTVQSATNGAVNFQLTYGTCQNGNINLKAIGTGYNIYVLDQEYSQGVNDVETVSGNTMNIAFTYNPTDFFSTTPNRHFVINFYPASSSSLEFSWNVTFVQDSSGNVQMSIERL